MNGVGMQPLSTPSRDDINDAIDHIADAHILLELIAMAFRHSPDRSEAKPVCTAVLIAQDHLRLARSNLGKAPDKERVA